MNTPIATCAADAMIEPAPLTVTIRRPRRAHAYRAESSPPPPVQRVRLGCSGDVFAALADICATDREHFVCFDLDVRHRVIARRMVSIGCLTGVEVHPREVFKNAILNSAAALIISHNHPSSDPTPSREDIELTRRLREVGTLVGITLLDHVIVVDGGWVSMAERGWS